MIEIDYKALEEKNIEDWHRSIWGSNYNPHKRGSLSEHSKY